MLEAVSLSPIEFTATTAFLANALEVSPTGTTASHRGSLEILYTIATVQAHNGSAITPTTMTGRHLTGMAILPILVTARGAIRLSIKCIATELVDYSGGTEAPHYVSTTLGGPLVSPSFAGYVLPAVPH
jgi:hypothetical protein